MSELTHTDGVAGGHEPATRIFSQPLLDENAEQRRDKAEHETREPNRVHANGRLRRREGYGR
jgi:hypothetical protein